MKRAMQALLISSDPCIRAGIVSGRTKVALRNGYLDYRPGPIILCSHFGSRAVKARITKVRHCSVAKLTRSEYLAAGFASRADMVTRVKRVRPNFSLASPVTVIRWANVRGKLVNDDDSGFHEARFIGLPR